MLEVVLQCQVCLKEARTRKMALDEVITVRNFRIEILKSQRWPKTHAHAKGTRGASFCCFAPSERAEKRYLFTGRNLPTCLECRRLLMILKTVQDVAAGKMTIERAVSIIRKQQLDHVWRQECDEV
jgi:hypothetical protein